MQAAPLSRSQSRDIPRLHRSGSENRDRGEKARSQQSRPARSSRWPHARPGFARRRQEAKRKPRRSRPKQRVAAGKAVGLRRRAEERFRSGALEGKFKGVLQYDGARHDHRQRDRGPPLSRDKNPRKAMTESAAMTAGRAEQADMPRAKGVRSRGGKSMDSRSNSLIETPGDSGRDRYRQPDEQGEASAGAGQQYPSASCFSTHPGSRAVSAAMRDHPWGPN